ncbi:hypothetical protein N7450_007290 [Penicillium hetheringtonii]|uniref:U6 snRNA phosphodiesterase 1 n=1 Tax=Penicillium hetheringtonii TaxID=911720 RepID=A0AAD6GQF7_9EURO|nr:hypothetical protein N7450_007290 [Penicillium hetheringtonii]
MSLVQYSDSDSNSEPSPPRKKIARPAQADLPPLPASFHSLYASSTRVSTKDDPSLHAGRKRAIPHVEGNWPSHLYLEWVPGKEELRLLTDLIQAADPVASNSISHDEPNTTNTNANAYKTANANDPPLHTQPPTHRPRRPITPPHQSFQTCHSTHRTARSIQRDFSPRPFHVSPQTLKWVSNYEKTRWFLVLRVSRPKYNNLNRLLNLCNSVLHRFGQPPLYAKLDENQNGIEDLAFTYALNSDSDSNSKSGVRPVPVPVPVLESESSPAPVNGADNNGDFSSCFHISIAWRLKAPDSAEVERVQRVGLDKVRAIDIPFHCVKAKIGNYVDTFELPARA